MISIGQDAAKNRLARHLVDEVLSECVVCEGIADHPFHAPAETCKECKAPQDHHTYQPRGESK